MKDRRECRVLTAIRGNGTHAVSRVGRFGEKIVQVSTACNRAYDAKQVELTEDGVVDCPKCLRTCGDGRGTLAASQQ